MQASDIADLVTSTLDDLGRQKITDNMSAYQNTHALKRLLMKGKVKFDDGKAATFNRITGTGESFRFVGMGAEDIVDVANVLGTGTVPWRHFTWNYAWEFREPLMNRGASRIVDLIKTRRAAELGSAVVGLERALWRVAAVDSNDMYGIPNWVVKSSTDATFANNDGLNGLAPSGYTTVAGINPSTDEKWRNYATTYTSVSKDDFVREARRMANKTNFKPLVEDGIASYNRGNDLGYYTNYTVYQTLVELLENQNENLGMNLAPYEGKVMFLGGKVEDIPELENDTTGPFYQINWGVFGAMGLDGAWMVETVKRNIDGQHTMSVIHTDCTLNTICYDRRLLGVLATGTGMPA